MLKPRLAIRLLRSMPSKISDDTPLRALATGATGHVGLAVQAGALAALPKATVTLLVRGRDVDEASERVQLTFAKFALGTPSLSRTSIVLGDVTQPELGNVTRRLVASVRVD